MSSPETSLTVQVSDRLPASRLPDLVASIEIWPGIRTAWRDHERRLLDLVGAPHQVEATASALARLGLIVTAPVMGEA